MFRGPNLLRRLLASALLITVAGAAGAASRDFDKVQIRATELRGGVWMLTGAGGNIGILDSPNHTLMIDDQYAPLSAKIGAAIEAITERPVNLLVNTHWHGDHTGGNRWFGGLGATIVTHENVHVRLLNDGAEPTALPTVTFSDQVRLHLGAETARIVATPHAHTDGDAFVYFEKANVLHAGDLFFNGLYPYIDSRSLGSLQGTIEAQQAMLTTVNSDTQIIPGHGPLADRADLAATVAKLIEIRDALRPLLDAGLSVDEIVARAPLSALNLNWSAAVMDEARFLRVVLAAMEVDVPE